MRDEDARFARALSVLVGRLDFWNMKDDFTAFEWAVLKTAQRIEPLGEKRADIRSAVATRTLVGCLSQAEINSEDLSRIADSAMDYLVVDDPEAIEKMETQEAIRKFKEIEQRKNMTCQPPT